MERILKEYKLYETLKSQNTGTDGTEEEEKIGIYLNKLIHLWHEKNPVIIPLKKEPEQKLQDILNAIKIDIDSGRYLKNAAKKEALELGKHLEGRYIDTLAAIDSRTRQLKAKKSYKRTHSPASSIRLEEDALLKKYIEDQLSGLKVAQEAMAEEGKYLEHFQQFSTWDDELTETINTNEHNIARQAQKSEQLVFACFGELDYDFLNSGQFSREEISMMLGVLEDILERALYVLNAYSQQGDIPKGIKEAEAMFAHIPVLFWPDRFVKELCAFKKVHEALLKEEQETLDEELESELEREGLATLFSEAGKGTLSDITTLSKALKEANRKSWYVTDEKDENGKTIKFNGFTGQAQSDPEKFFMQLMTDFNFAADLTDKTLTGIETLAANGKKNAEKRRAATLLAMKTVSSVLSDLSIRKSIDDKDFQGSAKAVASVIDVLVSAIELATADPETDISKIAKTTQEQIDRNVKKLETATKALLALGLGLSKAIKILDSIPKQVLPIFNMASGTVSLTVNVRQIAKEMVKSRGTTKLKERAKQRGDYDYLGPLEQELKSLDRRMLKRTIDSYGDVVMIAGGIADATVVGAPAGAALKVVAGVIKFGNKIVFTGVDEGMKAYARKLIKEARNGNRKAMMEVMSNSPRYAKMFIAMGCMEDPPHPIALEFVRQRGLTEKDLQQEHISAAYIRKFLLADAEESDDHKSKATKVKDFYDRVNAYHSKVKARHGFWSAGLSDRDYKRLHEVYRHDEIKRMVDKCIWCEQLFLDYPITTGVVNLALAPMGASLTNFLKRY
ncbi:MAG: hypothetical protein AAFV80_19285, partial [Bacteroidota bacterium]